MAKVLVTGAGGYIGTTLVPMLLRQGFEVRAIDRYFFGKTLLPENRMIEIVKEDTRRLQLEHFAGIDHVIDLAAISNDPSGELFQKPTWEINESARIRAAQLAKQAGVKRYILPSSCSIYGFHEGDVVVNESSPTNPLTTYAKANEKAEMGVLPLADEKFCVVVIRLQFSRRSEWLPTPGCRQGLHQPRRTDSGKTFRRLLCDCRHRWRC